MSADFLVDRRDLRRCTVERGPDPDPGRLASGQVLLRIDAFALQDAFIHSYGSHAELLAAHGLGPALIAERVGLEG